MEFNKILSFILGLVVVVVFIAVLTGRLNLGKRFAGIAKGGALGGPTPTPTLSVTPTPSVTQYQRISNIATPTPVSSGRVAYNRPTPTGTVKGVNSIPSTGLPTFFIPTLVGMFAGGIFLSKVGKKASN